MVRDLLLSRLEWKFLWPKEVVDVETLHCKWLLFENEEEKLQNYHPKLLEFESFFKYFRNRASDPVQYLCRITLPHPF